MERKELSKYQQLIQTCLIPIDGYYPYFGSKVCATFSTPEKQKCKYKQTHKRLVEAKESLLRVPEDRQA